MADEEDHELNVAIEALTVAEPGDDLKNFNIPRIALYMSPKQISELPLHVLKLVLPYTRAWPLGIFYEFILSKRQHIKQKLTKIQNRFVFNLRILSEAAFEVADKYDGHYDNLEWLFENGASPNTRRRQTPLLCALAKRKNTGKAFLLCLKYGADALVTSKGKTAFDIAANSNRSMSEAGYLNAPTPLIVALLEPESLVMCISHGAALPAFTHYEKDAHNNLSKITWVPNTDPSLLEAIPKSCLGTMRAAIHEWQQVWTPSLHKTWPEPHRGFVRFIYMCIRPRLPPELVAMIVGFALKTIRRMNRLFHNFHQRDLL